mgnify:CR=1 FL=1
MAKDALAALTQTLTEKMRAKFATLAQDVANQEVIAQEVMAFMTQGGSVKVEDVTRLEENIRLKLTGDKPKKRTWHKKATDEWTQIAMYEISEHQKALEQKTAIKNKNKTELRALLDEQVQERKTREAHEKDEAAQFFKVEEEALGKWREEEKHKQMKRVDAAMRLKLEREILGQIKRPPGMPSSMLGLEIMTGRDETMDFDDFMGAGSTQTLGMPEEDVDTRAILEKAHGLVPRSTLRVGPAAHDI